MKDEYRILTLRQSLHRQLVMMERYHNNDEIHILLEQIQLLDWVLDLEPCI